MKKGVLFLVLFFIILGGVYLYKRSFQTLPKFSPTNQTTVITPTAEKETESTSAKISQGLFLEVYQPKDKEIVNSSTITVVGKSSSGAEVFVNEKELKADSQGNFSTSLNLDEGENVITVVASDSQGNYAEKELMITLETVE